ncbi:ThiF family adenylyltransferase [Cellulomonas endophytica]|uniref:ThiF family adenylyltransferase n=1 Tax=Cellulomonas endophytica TaxID=2494735 RepID=UPI001011ECF8|nr:ThiF family adenylyltransferase [Cellulomonas endophytica]
MATTPAAPGAAPAPGRFPLVEPGPELDADGRRRWARHALVPEIGLEGQRRLRAARVLVVGAGGLGSPALLYLAAAGVGTLGVVDDDVVEVSNLQRQVVHGTADVGRPKVESARDAVAALDPGVRVVVHPERLTADNAAAVLAGYDLVLDGTDTFESRYLVGDTCAALGVPHVWGSVLRFDGQVSVFWSSPPAALGPAVTLRDVFPEPPPPGTVPSCAEAGVLGVVCGAVGSAMALEAVKLVCGIGEPLLGRVLVLDALSHRWREVPVAPDPGRVTPDPSVIAGGAPGARTAGAVLAGPAAAPPAAAALPAVTARELAALLAERDAGTADVDLVDVRDPAEHALVAIPGARLVPKDRLLAPGGIARHLDPARPLVLHCRSGARSAEVLVAVREAGHRDARHLAGGLLAWVDEVDPSLPRY